LQPGAPAPEAPLPVQSVPDLDRLSRAVEGLVERHRALRVENDRMRSELADRELQLAELSQQRSDARKRIDALIAQIDALDARLESGS
jgi:regulator of replication initiation timing